MTREESIEYNNNLREYMRIIDKNSEYKFLKENYEALDMGNKALEIVNDFETARIITGGRLNGRTYAYKCGLADGRRLAKAEFVSKRKLNEVISKMEELRKDGNSFAECADECIEILRDAMK